MMNTLTLNRIKARIRFLSMHGINNLPYDIDQLWTWRNQLGSMTLSELNSNNFNLQDISNAINSIERHIDYHTSMAGQR